MELSNHDMLMIDAQKKSPVVAVLLSFVLIGAGHWYSGRWFVGLLLLIVGGCLFGMAFIAPPLWVLYVPFWILVMIHASYSVGRYNQRLIKDYVRETSK